MYQPSVFAMEMPLKESEGDPSVLYGWKRACLPCPRNRIINCILSWSF